MKDLLQRLWNEYALMTKSVDDVLGDLPLTPELQKLSDFILDTPEMKKLREDLASAGVKFFADGGDNE